MGTHLSAGVVVDSVCGTHLWSNDVQEQSLNVVQHGLEYLKACYIPDPAEYGIQYGDVYVYQVGDVNFERRLWRRPEDVTVRLPCNP